MDLSTKTHEELITLTQASEDKETLRAIAEQVDASFSGNTGVEKLKGNILSAIKEKDETIDPPEDIKPEEDNDDEDNKDLSSPDPALMDALRRHNDEKRKAPGRPNGVELPDLSTLVNMNERKAGISEPLRRAIVRAKALRLIRCKVTNLDPADAAVPGMLLTVYNKYTGKVAKLIPFGEENENGYHIPKILVDELKSRTFNMRKEKKRSGSSFGVKEYTTITVRKFAIEELPQLTQEELDNLANDQKARGAIDQTV